ncbi:MAG: tetratricopeptide repeat-containing glycosyltransferase family protein [Steroidobacteraceae bacterium]
MEAELQQAIALHQQGQLLQARSIYESILRGQPRHFDALHLSGVLAAQMRDFAGAARRIGAALDIDRNNAVAFCNFGSACKELGQFESALAAYDRAIALRPCYIEAYYNRSIVQRELRQWDAAVASCDMAIRLRPGYAEAFCARGKVFREQRQWQPALDEHERALALQPGLAEAHVERGIALKELGQFEAALASYERAIALAPKDPYAYLNRGNLLKQMNDTDAALASYNQALSLDPNFATAHSNRSTILLLRGQFAEGWRDFEWRWRDRHSGVARQMRTFTQPRWRGTEPISGKTILLHHEQGLGDTLQFCRYATDVAERGARVILQVPPPLCELMGSLAGVSEIIAEGDRLPPFDCFCPLMSLPLAFETSLASIPARIPYLRAPQAKVRYWREQLGEKRRVHVGLVWSGGFRPGQPEVWAVHARRSIALEQLAPLRTPGIEFHSLQKGQPAESELAQLTAAQWDGPDIVDNTHLLHDFSDTAALIEALDLVISVDTSTAHLAGALGKPLWILNRFDTCWRWLQDRFDSPWYPTARIYRQGQPLEWAPVVARIRTDLDELARSDAIARTGA